MGIIGVSGRMQSGKDTVGKIIQYLVWKSKVEKGELPLAVYSFSNFEKEAFFGKNQSGFEIKKFADTLKDMVCLLIGCTREQLEDHEFKNTELGEEWWYFKGRNGSLITYTEDNKRSDEDLIKLTPRLLLQLLGTEAGRNIIHPNIWVNALMSNYRREYRQHKEIEYIEEKIYPNWIITDMRFPNELEAIIKRGGITIRVNRVNGNETPYQIAYREAHEHPSETALDNATFDYVINNNSTIEDLIQKVRIILRREKII